MIFLNLALKSLKNRRLTSLLTVFSIALSVALLLSVERVKKASEVGFTQSISQTDLIVGSRSGPINLLLYTVFNMGSASNNISWKSYDFFKNHPSVDWVIPYSLGDGHRGFRVVGTDENFYQHYRFRGDRKVEFATGNPALNLWDVVIGQEVAQKLKYSLGDKITIAHGVTRGEGILHHDDKPFVVVGILKATGTSIDRSLYITLGGLEALHLDWKDGAMPSKDEVISQQEIKKEELNVTQITAFFLRTKSRIETLRLQREINTYKEEPLLAIIPGVTLAELWQGLSYVEKTLKIISWLVVAVGLLAMMIALLTGLNERRREMAILRALGAGPQKIVLLLMFESGILTLLGIILGAVLHGLGFLFLKHWLETEFGLYMQSGGIALYEFFILLVMFILGLMVGTLPAFKAMRTALKDGLSLKV